MKPYQVEAYSDFSDAGVRVRYRQALATVQAALPAMAPAVVHGETVSTDRVTESIDPAAPDVVVGVAASGTPGLAERALESAWNAFGAWSSTPAESRAELVHRIGDLMAERRFELAAWMTREAGKNWAEAEADAAEAIDFCRYYAHQALRMAEPLESHRFPGETNESRLQAIGAGVVIPPWNFPLAILVGMAVGPVAAGNTVVIKPASNTPVIGYRFMEIVAASGLPAGVINFVPGTGSEVGEALVDHAKTRFVNFTGSRDVGLRINERAAVVQPGQRWIKRAFMELGGKDAIVVDETANLDAAAQGIVASAYGFQGQKCSACSRLIVVDRVHDGLVDRVVDLASSLSVGPPSENHPVGPLISATQHAAVLAEIDKGTSEGRLLTGGAALAIDGGYYVEPTIFADVDPGARLAQHEIFGPVLSIIRVPDVDTAFRVANDTDYGLTGGIYSTDEERIAKAVKEFHVGNLYINRKITGALVGIQPFGGFKLSGSNAKAGGPDYLRLFMEMKTVSRRL